MSGNPVIVCMPTANGMVVPYTLWTLYAVRPILERPMYSVICESTGVAKCRNLCLEGVREAFPDRREAWILWLDNDMNLPETFARPLADAIRWAEETGRSWSANCRMANRENVLMDEAGRHFTDDELKAMPEWSPIGFPSLALAYVRMPLDYVFHEDTEGEDTHFHRDLRIPFHFAKNLGPIHHKTVHLAGPRTWEI